jgi:hypothetical protein
MQYDEFDLPGDGQAEDPPDLPTQIAEAETRLAELRKRSGAAEKAEAGAQPGSTAGAVPGGPPPGLLERLSDRSVDWPTLQQELASHGFVDARHARPAGRQPGMRTLGRVS